MDSASVDRVEAALAPLRAEPASAAILCDLDGTLAPIVERPEGIAIPERARVALKTIAARYGLTAIVTGRRAAFAREIVGLEELTYVGNHGYELLRPGDEEAAPAPALAEVAGDVPAFVAALDGASLESAGIRFEDKGPIVGLHWRGVEDEERTEAAAERVAADARAAGLDVHYARKIIELRPQVQLSKGTAVEALLAAAGVSAAFYAGDDLTDLDAFAALERLNESGALRAAVRIGVRSAEGPDEIAAAADVVVDGPGAMPAVLEALVG